MSSNTSFYSLERKSSYIQSEYLSLSIDFSDEEIRYGYFSIKELINLRVSYEEKLKEYTEISRKTYRVEERLIYRIQLTFKKKST